ncbi:MAG: TIGR02300 family protein [Rhodobacteraceae bacterium]|nr:TIGR02300 family protein [Paracoccaceae bacterium]
MPKEEWGVKRACPKCAVRFYDLQTDPMTCPACGAEFSVESLLDTGKSRVAATKQAKAAAAPVVDEAEVVLDDGDETTTPDDDLLDDDDDDTVNLEEIADVAKEEDDS